MRKDRTRNRGNLFIMDNFNNNGGGEATGEQRGQKVKVGG
jgi:hypothetical protein